MVRKSLLTSPDGSMWTINGSSIASGMLAAVRRGPGFPSSRAALLSVGLLSGFLLFIPTVQSDELAESSLTSPANVDSTDDPGNLMERLTGDEIAQRINARDDGQQVTRTMILELVSWSGKKRIRVTRTFRKQYPGEKRTAIFYLKPKSVKGTAFLNIDYAKADQEDVRWMYLPSLRKVRRISASNRGDYFLGTDFTYEDINNETKVNIDDYHRTNQGTGVMDTQQCLILQAVPLNKRIQEELGYSRVVSYVDPQMWMLRRAEYWDSHGKRLKIVYFRNLRLAQGIWTAQQIHVQNHQTGHQTTLIFENIDYQTTVDDKWFTKRALQWGL